FAESDAPPPCNRVSTAPAAMVTVEPGGVDWNVPITTSSPSEKVVETDPITVRVVPTATDPVSTAAAANPRKTRIFASTEELVAAAMAETRYVGSAPAAVSMATRTEYIP